VDGAPCWREVGAGRVFGTHELWTDWANVGAVAGVLRVNNMSVSSSRDEGCGQGPRKERKSDIH
jgi:hypothetical protein